MLVKESPDGLGNPDHLRRRRPREQLFTHTGIAAHAATGEHTKTGDSFADLGNESQIGYLRQGAVGCTATEGNLVLARQVVASHQWNQIFGHRIGKRRNVKTLVRADSCIGARGDVPNRIPSSAFARQADSHQAAHDFRRVCDGNSMELDILSRGDMQQAIAKLCAQPCEQLGLLIGEGSAGNTNSDHVRTILSLFINTSGNTLCFEDTNGNLAGPETLDILAIGFDVCGKIIWKVVEGFTHRSVLLGCVVSLCNLNFNRSRRSVGHREALDVGVLRISQRYDDVNNIRRIGHA